MYVHVICMQDKVYQINNIPAIPYSSFFLFSSIHLKNN